MSEEIRQSIKTILIGEYKELLEMYETFERMNQLEYAAQIKTAMDEVDIIANKIIGCDISPFVLEYFC